jgi:hypothetical protein
MSGSSGGGYDPVPSDDCKKLATQASIISPDPEVLKKISKGDTLILKLKPTRGPIEAFFNKEILGSVLAKASLVECMNAGHQFEGTVIEKHGGKVVILITPI